MSARRTWAGICPQCNIGTPGACDCLIPAESCTELGADTRLPLHQPAAAYIFAPLFDRWPRFAGLVAALCIVALLGLAGERPVDILAAEHLPGDGFPAELLAMPAEASASEAQP